MARVNVCWAEISFTEPAAHSSEETTLLAASYPPFARSGAPES